MMFPEQREEAIRHLSSIYEQHLKSDCYDTRCKFNNWIVSGFAGVSSFSDRKIIKELNFYSGRQREGVYTSYYGQMYKVDQLLADLEIERMLT